MTDIQKSKSDHQIIDAEGHIELTAKGLPNVGFHVGGYDKENKSPERTANEKQLSALFEKFQDELDKNNPVAVQLLKDIAETNMPSHINLNSKDINKTDMREGVNLDFDYPHEYFTKDGTAQFTPARIFSHELAHLAGEKTTENRENKISVADRNKYFNSQTSTQSERDQKIEEPAVKAENYICSHIFGSAACGPERVGYPIPKEEHHSMNDFEGLRSAAIAINQSEHFSVEQKNLLNTMLAEKANSNDFSINQTQANQDKSLV